ncbi:Exportin-4 [Physocladia obscura]|uniref:Exportin-4 n=1 Tax=Physocladia obscura TaxID=109957 RepID=A0AAD5XFJ1_9FUNG|nr:Exportin-4 [Physocladia obscura]
MNDGSGDELIVIADIIKRTLSTHSVSGSCISQIPDFFKFMSTIANFTIFTITCVKKAVGSNFGDGEECPAMLATNIILEMWASFVDQANALLQSSSPPFTTALRSFLQSLALPIFSAYLDMRLVLAAQQVVSNNDDENAMGGGEDDLNYGDQLDCLNLIARWDPKSCCGLLRGYIEECAEKLESLFGNRGSSVDETTRSILLERIHWLILISEHILADSGDGEVPMIPESLLEASVRTSYALVSKFYLIRIVDARK